MRGLTKAAAGIALLMAVLGGCAVYEPAPAPGYYAAPGYYVPDASVGVYVGGGHPYYRGDRYWHR